MMTLWWWEISSNSCILIISGEYTIHAYYVISYHERGYGLNYVLYSPDTIMGHAPELLIMAGKYQVPLLEAMCEEAIVSNLLNVDNCIPLFQFADTHGSIRMQKSIIRFIRHHVDDLRVRQEYTALSNDEKTFLQQRILSHEESDLSTSHSVQRFIPHFGGASSTSKTGKFSFCCVM